LFDLTIKKEDLISPLLAVAGAVDKKQSLAILSNFLLRYAEGILTITATDLEIEISAQVPCVSNQLSGSFTVPAKKFIDILRALNDTAMPVISFENGYVSIKHERSLFKLATLPAESYPLSEDECNEVEINLPRLDLLKLLQSTHFAMAQQDVRIFLNGLLLEFDQGQITAVATDGHRMAVCRYSCSSLTQTRLLLPKKGVQELLRILISIEDETVLLSASKSHFKLVTKQYHFLSKLIEARFPPYAKAIPVNQDKQLIVDCALLKRALSRIVILAHEKSKAVLLHMQQGQLTLVANNNESEEAIETLSVETQGDDLKIGLNATYLLDVLSHFSDGQIRISMSDTDSSILIESLILNDYQYIIMPMKI
jgi:DNA polymerase-3 subunit beta